MRVRIVALTIVLLAVACSWGEATGDSPASQASPTTSATQRATPEVFATRMTALAAGVLSDEDGCLRIGNTLLVFPPDQHEVVRKGDTVEVTDFAGGITEPIVWRLGEQVTVGGGSADGRAIPHQPFPDHCSGPYWLVGDVSTR